MDYTKKILNLGGTQALLRCTTCTGTCTGSCAVGCVGSCAGSCAVRCISAATK